MGRGQIIQGLESGFPSVSWAAFEGITGLRHTLCFQGRVVLLEHSWRARRDTNECWRGPTGRTLQGSILRTLHHDGKGRGAKLGKKEELRDEILGLDCAC